jgi:hypothetical protein
MFDEALQQAKRQINRCKPAVVFLAGSSVAGLLVS